MKFIVLILLSITSFLSLANTTVHSTLPIEKPMIVGGELASEGDWPWMTALVYTYSGSTNSLDVAGINYDSVPFLFGPIGQASAVMVDCGIGDSQCDFSVDKICLISRGEIDFTVKVANCQSAGGIAAIIFNNTSGELNFTLGENFISTIPVIGVSQNNGLILLNNLDSVATIIVNPPTVIGQSVSCGASFIGTKWVLTAAHCVEEANIDELKVNIGEYDLRNGASKAIAINRIHIHPEYNEDSGFNNDIALIELVESIDHPAITLLDRDESTRLAQFNSPATVMGWGNIDGYGSEDPVPENNQPDKLLQVELSLLSNEQCKEKLVQSYQELDNATYSTDDVGLTDGMICASYSGSAKGSCQGDSGGPLIVNTNQGWQQIGIVSFGIGCANAAFPDVFTRVGNFATWINTLTKAVEFEPNYDFAITPQYQAQKKQLTVTNNSDFTANLTFTLVPDTLNSSVFNLTSDSCSILASKQTCQVLVTFDALIPGQHEVKIVMDSGDENIPTSQIVVSAQAIPFNSHFNTSLTNDSDELLWFSGGEKAWRLDDNESTIISGELEAGQQSIAILTFSGEGRLSFDWAVLSEESTSNSNIYFDALYLIIDGEQIDLISGKMTYNNITIDDFSAGPHQVTWLYKKNEVPNDGNFNGFLKNITFSSLETISSENNPTTKSSGGSLNLSLLILFLIFLHRRPLPSN